MYVKALIPQINSWCILDLEHRNITIIEINECRADDLLRVLNDAEEGIPEISSVMTEILGQGTPPKTFDFESVYLDYPKKLGKASGMKWLKQHIRSQGKFEDLQKSVKNYNRYIEIESVKEQYVKHFSSFVRKYEDWINPGSRYTEQNPIIGAAVNYDFPF